MSGADNEALIVVDKQDSGRVAMLLSDSMYLWERGYEGGGPYATLLGNMTQWLLKNPAMAEENLEMVRRNDQIIINQQTMADLPSPLIVTTPSGKTITVEPEKTENGLWTAIIPADEVGEYKVVQDGGDQLEAYLNTGPKNPKEFENTVSTTLNLAPVIGEEGNKHAGYLGRLMNEEAKYDPIKVVPVHNAEDGSALSGKDWAGIRMNDGVVVQGHDREPLIPPWLGALAIAGLFMGAWLREREDGLLGKLIGKKGDPEQDDEAQAKKQTENAMNKRGPGRSGPSV